MTGKDGLQLVVRRFIEASPARLFEAWTAPSQLVAWWGPDGVRCNHAEVDLKVGGRYRLGNELPEGRTVFIVGEFLVVDPPTRLAYTWSLEHDATIAEHVTVRFEARDAGTDVVVTHERIRSEHIRREHAAGWNGCLDGLTAHIRL